MKIGMCGVRGIGSDFLNLFGLHPEVDSVAVADLDANVRAKSRQFAALSRAVETLDQLLDTNVDSIGVFTPPWVGSHLCAILSRRQLAELN